MTREERLKLWADSGLDIDKPIYFTEEAKKNPPEYLKKYDLTGEYSGLPNYIKETKTRMAIYGNNIPYGLWVRREDITN